MGSPNTNHGVLSLLILASLYSVLLPVCGCTVSRWSGSKPFIDESGREIRKAEDIIIEEPGRRLPERETLKFSLKLIGIQIGTVTMSIKGIEMIDGREAYHLEALFESSGFLSRVYKISDRFVSFMDVENLRPLRQEVFRSEGGFRKKAITRFDHTGRKAYFTDLLNNVTREIDIPEGAQDTLSACYYFLLLPLKSNDSIDYHVYNSEMVYRLKGSVGDKVFIKTALFGIKDAFEIQPYVELNGKRVKKGELSAYFSCDSKRLPLMGRIKGVVFADAVFTLSGIE